MRTNPADFPLGKAGVDFLEARAIDVEIAMKHGVHTVRSDRDRKVMVPDIDGWALAFPYFEHDQIVNTKYRGIKDKRYWQAAGGKSILWNVDVLDDPAVTSGANPAIITEGELDALAAITAGFPFTTSVPEGASKPRGDGSIDEGGGKDTQGKFRFMWNCRDRLMRVKRFILAVDDDEAGERLAEELVRRLLAGRCSRVTYPKGSKDTNEVLRDGGAAAVAWMFNNATPFPIRGIYKLSQYPERHIDVVSTGIAADLNGNDPLLDAHLKLFPGQFIVVTGIPSHGKSTLVSQVVINAAALHGWRSLVFSPEMPVVPYYRDRMRRVIGGSPDQADDFIERYITFIDHSPMLDDEDITIDAIIKRSTEAVMRDGIRIVVIDPWNEVEHEREKGESMVDYISWAIRQLRRMAQQQGLVVIVVAHPTKDVKGRDGKVTMPTLYDIEGAAHWFNKSDHGIIVHRDDEFKRTLVSVAKSRFEELAGKRGKIYMSFDENTQRFERLDKQAQLLLLQQQQEERK
jgi:twinkle protein